MRGRRRRRAEASATLSTRLLRLRELGRRAPLVVMNLVLDLAHLAHRLCDLELDAVQLPPGAVMRFASLRVTWTTGG